MDTPPASPSVNLSKFIGIGLVVLLLTGVVAVLLPMLSTAKRMAIQSKLRSDWASDVYSSGEPPRIADKAATFPAPLSLPAAHVKSFEAKVDLTPRLSIGTADPESIYEAKFEATIAAVAPAGVSGGASGGVAQDCQIELPLPPSVISLSDLSIKVGAQESDAVALAGGKLVWHGPLPAGDPTQIALTYTAIGKGIYSLDIPPGKILDLYHIELTAHESDVRMLQEALQPTTHQSAAGTTTYVWDYKKLMFGRPIKLDVLGIAPLDRLGELSWLGPISVLFFGVFLAMVAQAYHAEKLDIWMLLFILGAFTGAYPLMYFAQEFVALNTAILGCASVIILIIAVRGVTLFGWRLGVAGVVAPAVLAMSIALVAVAHPKLQGLLLTAEAIGFFVAATVLAPRLRQSVAAALAAPPAAALVPPTMPPRPAPPAEPDSPAPNGGGRQ